MARIWLYDEATRTYQARFTEYNVTARYCHYYDGSYSRYLPVSTSWEVVDENGAVLFDGAAQNGRQAQDQIENEIKDLLTVVAGV